MHHEQSCHYLLEPKQPEDGLALIYKKLFSRQSCTKVAIACNRQSTENMTFSPACYTIRLTGKNVTVDLKLALVNEDQCQLKIIVHKELFHDESHDCWFRNHPPRRTVLDCWRIQNWAQWRYLRC